MKQIGARGIRRKLKLKKRTSGKDLLATLTQSLEGLG